MSAIPDLLSLATTLLAVGLIVAGVMKLFQIATDLQEMKEVLKDIRRAGSGMLGSVPPPLPASLPNMGLASLAGNLPGSPSGPPLNPAPTPEELVRAVHAQDFRGDDFPL